ncbi:hypothetical protein, partial [Roseinatronobacter ekhonensis]|uniref:hypothetical protein n=1 Tax=Roseinatronobacter ekhonensis TaxID=254356 RepID=UPI001C7DE1A6
MMTSSPGLHVSQPIALVLCQAPEYEYTPSPAEAEFVDLTAGFGTIQLLLMIRPDFLSSPARLELEAC